MKHIMILSFVFLLACREKYPELDQLLFVHDGYDRSCLVYAPAKMDTDTSMPLVLVLHGGGGKSESMIGLTKARFHELSRQHGFIVAYPEGLRKGWNDGRGGEISFSSRNQVDDVGFIRELIHILSKHYPVDQDRVFVCGISNGGMMSLTLALKLSNKIRGIVAVTANIPASGRTQFGNYPPVNTLIINGTEDPLVPFDGGMVRVLGKDRGEVLSTFTSMKILSEALGCNGTTQEQLADRDPGDGTRIIKTMYSNCNNNTQLGLLEIRGGGHTWPGGAQYLGERYVGKTSRDINAADVIWEFFSGQ